MLRRAGISPRGGRGPRLELRQRVDRLRRLRRVPAVGPDLEVQVRAGRVAGHPDLPERLPRRQRLALLDRDRPGHEVHEHVVDAVGPALDDVVAGAARLVGDPVDRPGDRRDERRALRGGHVLALVDVAGPARAEARVRTAERVLARDGEDAGRRRRRRGRRRGRRLDGQPQPARRRGRPPQPATGAVERLQRDRVVARRQRGRLPRVGVAHARPPVAEPQPDDARAPPEDDPHAHLARPPAHAVGELHGCPGGDRGGGDGELARHRPGGHRALEARGPLRRLPEGHGPVAGRGRAAGGRVGRGRGGRQGQHADEHGRRARQGEQAAHGTGSVGRVPDGGHACTGSCAA